MKLDNIKKILVIIILGLTLNGCATPMGQEYSFERKNKYVAKTHMWPKSGWKNFFTGYTFGIYKPHLFDFYSYSNVSKEDAAIKSENKCNEFRNKKNWNAKANCRLMFSKLTQMGERTRYDAIENQRAEIEKKKNKEQQQSKKLKTTKIKKTENQKKEEEKKNNNEEDILEQFLKDVYGDRKLDNIEGLWGYRRDDEKEGRIYLIFKSDDYLYEEQVIYHPIREFEGQISTKIVKKIDNNLYETKATWLNVDKVDVRNGTIKIIDKFKLKFETSRHCYSSEKECLKAGVVYKKKIWPSKTYADDIGLTNEQSDVLKGLLD